MDSKGGWKRLTFLNVSERKKEILKKANNFKIGPRLDMPIGRQSFATITPIWNGASNKN